MPLGACSHLCGLAEYMIAADVLNIQAHHAGHVRAVDGRENAFRAGQRAEFFGWQHDAGERGDVAEEHDTSAGSNGVIEEIEYLGGVLYGPR